VGIDVYEAGELTLSVLANVVARMLPVAVRYGHHVVMQAVLMAGKSPTRPSSVKTRDVRLVFGSLLRSSWRHGAPAPCRLHELCGTAVGLLPVYQAGSRSARFVSCAGLVHPISGEFDSLESRVECRYDCGG
jgi:hypothetical protein